MTAQIFELNADTVRQLKERGILREDTPQDIELDVPHVGEVVLGRLTNFEREVFCEVASLKAEVEERTKEIVARSAELYAASIRKSTKIDPEQFKKNFDESKIFQTNDDAEEFFGLEERLMYLRSLHSWSIKSRFGFGAIYGVRSGWQVVRVQYKYMLPENATASNS